MTQLHKKARIAEKRKSKEHTISFYITIVVEIMSNVEFKFSLKQVMILQNMLQDFLQPSLPPIQLSLLKNVLEYCNCFIKGAGMTVT